MTELVDLRSDYYPVVRPEVVDAMIAASREAGGFETRTDRSVRDLETLAAGLLGKEDALFLPTCSMANQIAIQLFCRGGDGFVAETSAHVVVAEAGAPAALSGATALPFGSGAVLPDVADLQATLDEPSVNVVPRLLVLENTHTRLGGLVTDVVASAALAARAHASGLAVHLDGARLLNACVALQCAPHELAAGADTASLSLNKGLGAPVGAVLAGSREHVGEATRIRLRAGGNWRGAGALAAAAAAALRGGYAHLARDHAVARRLAAALEQCPAITVLPAQPRTNLVLVDLHPPSAPASAWIEALAGRGVLALARGTRRLRFVLNASVTEAQAERAAAVLCEVAQRLGAEH